MRRILLIPTFLILSLIGCTSLSEKQSLEPQVTSSATAAPIATETVIPKISVSPTSMPKTSPPVTATELPASTSTPIISPITAVNQRCSASEPLQVEQTNLAQGLVVAEREKVAVLGSDGLQNPIWFYQYPDNTFSTISPDGKWIAFITYNEVDRVTDTYSIAMRVTNLEANQEFQVTLEILILSRFEPISWINDSQLIVPLANEGELFHWLVWSPFDDRQETLSVEATGLGVLMERFSHPPTLDPLLELVVYPCETCGEAEYAVKRIDTGEISWFIDLGDNPAYDVLHAPVVWSPDGQVVAVLAGELSNHLLFFDRQGEKLHEVVLPVSDYTGTLGLFSQTWSPDSEYLAFLRPTVGSEGEQIESLSYVNVKDGRLIDLCIDAHTGSPIWSPDSAKIAFSQQLQSGEQSRLISIVDIGSGDVVQLPDVNAYTLLGWMSLLQDK